MALALELEQLPRTIGPRGSVCVPQADKARAQDLFTVPAHRVVSGQGSDVDATVFYVVYEPQVRQFRMNQGAVTFQSGVISFSVEPSRGFRFEAAYDAEQTVEMLAARQRAYRANHKEGLTSVRTPDFRW